MCPEAGYGPPPGRAYTPAGLAAATGTMLAWAAGIILIKLTTSPYLVVSFYRLLLAMPFLLVAWLASGRPRLPWAAGTVGGLLFAVHQVFHFGALRFSTAAVVTILFALQPIIVGAGGGRLTGERTTPRFYLWSGVAVAGCVLLVWAAAGEPQTSAVGTVMAVANLLAFSAYYVATKRARERTAATSWLVVMTAVSGIVILALVVATGEPLGSPSAREWVVLGLIGFVPGTVGHLLITWAHPRIHAAASSAVTLGVPVLASVGAAVVVDEPFGPLQAAGGVVALAGAAMAMRHLPPIVPIEAAETYGEVAT